MSYRIKAIQISTGEIVRGIVKARSLRAAEEVAEAKALLLLRATPGDVIVVGLNECAPAQDEEADV